MVLAKRLGTRFLWEKLHAKAKGKDLILILGENHKVKQKVRTPF